jgi:gliding motility-associated-like protein
VKIRSLFLILSVLLFISTGLSGQNDECATAYYINNVEDFCSEIGDFSNAGATPSAEDRPFCWPDLNHDVWFAFAPTKPGVFIQLTGLTGEGVGTLQLPSVAVYDKPCSQIGIDDHIACASDLLNENVVELNLTNLIIGQVYYIRVDARNGNTGTFRLCIDVFNPVKVPESDCDKAVVLCDKSPFIVENLTSVGDDPNEVAGSCIQEEFASVWYKWTCQDPGTLTFVLRPTSSSDDLDFALYRLPNGLNDCDNKELIRCMASGETIGESQSYNAPCTGATGLSLSSDDVREDPGCNDGSDNFLAAVNMQAGESFALIVNNFSQSGSGFEMTFGGTGTFQGPEPDIIAEAVDAFECDKTIIFTDNSVSTTDPIISYLWNFGAGADRSSASTQGPHDIVYESFGPKTVALTVESSRGCLVTEILDIYIEACCQDTSTLYVEADKVDLVCHGIPEGIIIAEGHSGAPQYGFSLDAVSYQPSPYFYDLDAGDYTLYIQDIKGCENQVDVTLTEPPPIFAFAGPDTVVDLGYSIFLDGDYLSNGPVSFEWKDVASGIIGDNTGQRAEVRPYESTYFEFSIIDEFGCIDRDSVYVRVNVERPVYAPNVFTANNDGRNDIFSIFAGPAAEIIEELSVFDRWGELIYRGENLPLNERSIGWDGTFRGVTVNPGVYVWMARIRFIDGASIHYSGDITLLR